IGQRGLATRAASFRYGGRHHSGIPGDIIPLYPGDFVGIRTHGRNARARTSPFSSTGNTRRRLPCRRNADPYTALLRRFPSDACPTSPTLPLQEMPGHLHVWLAADLYNKVSVLIGL